MSPLGRAAATHRSAEIFREFRISCVHLRREREALDALEGKEVAWRFLCKLCRERWGKPGDSAGFSGDGRGMWDIFGWMYHEIPLLKRCFLDIMKTFLDLNHKELFGPMGCKKEICTIQGLADMYDMYNGVFICISVGREG